MEEENDKALPYTTASFRNQTRILKEELLNLGVKISLSDAARISFLSRRKYERYDHFYPGESFDSRLFNWLEINFEKNERQIAIDIIKNLKFISEYEMKELAIQTFEKVRYTILNELENISEKNWYTYIESRNIKLEKELAKSIFVACADDIHFDFFRRYAMEYNPFFKKDNFVEYYKRDKYSLNELHEYNRIFLLDQFSGSGITAIRYENDKWDGKIPTFQFIWNNYIEDVSIYYCPYLLSSRAKKNLDERISSWLCENPNLKLYINPTYNVPISPCLVNEQGTDINENKPVSKLCVKYYDRFEEDEHTKKGGPVCYGYGRAGLTLVFQSNCPNNSIPLLWHRFNNWYPLFPRVSHHR